MSRARLFLLPLGLLLVWLLSITALRENLGSDIRLFNNDSDRRAYFEHGRWLTEGKVPYRDVFSEYPQVATYLFGVPYVLAAVNQPAPMVSYGEYSAAFALLMLVGLFLTLELLDALLPDERRHLAWLMLLPAPLYFTINRFDILPALACLVALRLLQRGRQSASAVALAVGAMTKWYPALLLPVFVLHVLRREHRVAWPMVAAFGLTCLVIVAPTLWSGGMDALLVPYRFHGARGLVTGSLPLLLDQSARYLAGTGLDGSSYRSLFVLLQLAGLPLCLFARMKTLDDVLDCSLLVVIPFVLFSRVASPQWILWILPLAILTARSGADVAWLVFYSVATYVVYPLAWDRLGEHSFAVSALWAVLFVVLLRLAMRSFGAIRMRSRAAST